MPAPSRRLLHRTLLAAVLCLSGVFVAACGGSGGSDKGLLTAAQSRTISSSLSAIASAVRAHSCSRAKTAVNELETSLQSLPSSTSARLVQNLGRGASTVKQLALTDCAHAPKTHTKTTSTSTSTSTSSTPTTTPTTPTTTQTTTTSAPTTTAPTTPNTTPQTTPNTTPSTPATTPTTPTPPPSTGGGKGGGGGGGGAGLAGGGNGQ